MIGRERRGNLLVGDDARAKPFGQRHARLPAFDAARHAAGQNDRRLGIAQQLRRFGDDGRRRCAFDLRHVTLGVDRCDLVRQFHFLNFGVEIDVSRAARRGIGDPVGAQNRFARGDRGGRLVVPFGIAAHQRALIARGVDPVDPRPPLHGVDRPGGAENDHRHAVAPGIEDRHGAVHQADVGMDRRRHRLAGDLGVALRDRDRRFLVQTEQHLWLLVAEIVHQAVVQAAVAGARIERDIRNVEGAQRIGDHIAAKGRGVDASGNGTVERADIGRRCFGRIAG